MLRRVLALGLLVLPGCALAPEREPARTPAPPPFAPHLGPSAAAPSPVTAEDHALAAAFASDEESSAFDDDPDEEPEGFAASPRKAPQSPLLALSDDELSARYRRDPASVGPISAGPARGGVLVNGVQMPPSDRWILLDPGRAWGTQETVDALVHIIGRVHERYPGSQALPIGHISARTGGHLKPHLSHQSGRDVDVAYYYRTPLRSFVTVTADNLDMPRTWALVKASVKETDVEMVLMDSSVQRLLADYAAQNGEDPAFIDEAFQIRGKNARAPIRHIRGHRNHLHFRFHNPVAEEMGRRLARHLVFPKAPPVTAARHTEVAGVTFANHKARNGDTLMVLAKRYGTTVEDIQRANNLKSNALKAGAVYKIPQKAAPKAAPAKPAPAKPAASHAPGHKPAPAAKKR